MKCAKIIVFYFGRRRGFNNNAPNIKSMIPEIIDKEINLDKGYPTDSFFVINKSGHCDDDSLDEYDNKNTINGKIKIIKRDNIGLSFGGYLDAVKQYRNEYDYWFFIEDDVIMLEPLYIKSFIDELNTSKESNFIALAPISNYIKQHCGGGCGLTSSQSINQIYTNENIEIIMNRAKLYEGYDVCRDSLRENNLEVLFTSKFKLKNHSKYSPLCLNYEKHSAQRSWARHYEITPLTKFIYKVGL